MRIPILKGLLVAVIFRSIMAAQPQIVQIKPSTSDLAATGVQLVPLDDIGHSATVEAILAGDTAPMLAALLPAGGVLVVNGSSKKLKIVSVAFRGPDKDQADRMAKLVITEELPVASGASLVFTPGSLLNHYLAASSNDRQKLFPAGAQTASSPSAGAAPSTAADFPSFVKESMSRLPMTKFLEAYLAGVAFDDNTFVGSDFVLGPLQRSMPEIHR